MRKRLAGFLLAAALCRLRAQARIFVKVDDVALGRVVVYRNGVAFYERRATVVGRHAHRVSVPRDRVDDFLKSLTVVDAITQQAAAGLDPAPAGRRRRLPRDEAAAAEQGHRPTSC